MQDLRLVGLSEDGDGLLLTDAEKNRYRLPMTDELRSAVRRDRQVSSGNTGEKTPQAPLRPRDVQGLIRGGVALEEIAERAGWSLEKVMRYEGPIRAERDYVAELAQRVVLPSRTETETLRERADKRLAERDVEAERVVWDSWKSDDTHWTVVVRFPAGGRLREATWQFDPISHALRTMDDEARWLGGDEIAAAAPQTAPEKKPSQPGRKRTARRPEADARVYDVEAEGGLAEEAQAPHLGTKVAAVKDSPEGLTASMRARQASRTRAKGRPAPARPTSVPGFSEDAAQAGRLERIATDGPEPPLPSHPRPDQLPAPAAAPDAVIESSAVERDDADESAQPETSSSRRRSRRGRGRGAKPSVRSALTNDDDENDESLFGDLPGIHEVAYSEDEVDAVDAVDLEDDSEVAGEDADEATTDDEGTQERSGDSGAGDVAASDDDSEEEDDPSSEGETSTPARPTSSKTAESVPERASQSRKSGRPSVPSWDDIMFGGRGPRS